MIDYIYKTVQAILNKDQLGYLKPLYFNLFLANAHRKVYNKYLADLKSNVRKSNWMLDGKNLANYSEHTRQLVEYFSDETDLATPTPAGGENPITYYVIPSEVEFIEDVFKKGTNTRIDKVSYQDFRDLQRSIYAKPDDCSPVCVKVGQRIKVASENITEIDLHFLRKPKYPKWTFVTVDGKPMFNPNASDFQDVDMPETSSDELISVSYTHLTLPTKRIE